jgi:hypothetical protein
MHLHIAFDLVEPTNSLTFNTEASLGGIDNFINKVRFKIRDLDEQVVTAIREQVGTIPPSPPQCSHWVELCFDLFLVQSKSGTKAKNDLQDAERAIHVSHD